MSSARELVQSCSNIFMLPEIHFRVRDIVDDSTSTMDDLADALKIEQAIRHQLSPQKAGEYNLHASIVHLAGAVTDHAELAPIRAEQSPLFDPFALSCMQFNPDERPALLKEAQGQLQDTLSFIYPLAMAA